MSTFFTIGVFIIVTVLIVAAVAYMWGKGIEDNPMPDEPIDWP